MSETGSSSSSTSSSGRQRKRRRVRSVSKEATLGALRRNLFWGMVLLSALGTAYLAQQMRLATIMGGVLMPGMTEQEVRYLRGAPAAIRGDGTRWLYNDSDTASTVLRFDPGQRVRSISCFGVIGLQIGCADVMGITLGSSEDQVINRLGPPNSRVYIPNGKVLAFGDMGLAFTMREYKVVAITKVQRSDGLSFLPRIAWNILP